MAEAQEWVAPKSVANPTTRAFFINPLPECYNALLSSTSEPVHSKKIIFGGPFTTMAVEQLGLAGALNQRRSSPKTRSTNCDDCLLGTINHKWSQYRHQEALPQFEPPVQHKYQQASTGVNWVLWALTTMAKWKFMSNTH